MEPSCELLRNSAEEKTGEREPSTSSPTELHLYPQFFPAGEGLSLYGVEVKKIAVLEKLDQVDILLSQKKCI